MVYNLLLISTTKTWQYLKKKKAIGNGIWYFLYLYILYRETQSLTTFMQIWKYCYAIFWPSAISDHSYMHNIPS